MTVADFMDLEDNEHELSKNDIAKYLDLYYRFSEKVGKKYLLGENFKSMFFSCGDFGTTIFDNTINTMDYDYMLQIARFFTLNKIYSLFIDSNHKYLELSDMDDPDMLAKYEVEGSRHHDLKNALKLIRNSLNHNDKKDFELFRIISEEGNPDLSIEIYLRIPNLHLKMPIEVFNDILMAPLKSKSAYNFELLDFDDKKINDCRYLKELLKFNGVKYKITHRYNFDDNDVDENGVVSGNSGDTFERIYSLTEEQKSSIMSNSSYLNYVSNDKMIDFLPLIIRDSIPFGMTKIDDYMFDLNCLFPILKDWKNSYADVVRRIKNEEYSSTSEEINNVYRTLNIGNVSSRGFSLYASYILDSVISDNLVNINGSDIKKEVMRDSFVHGRWFNYKDGLKDKITLYDYEHGDDKIMEEAKCETYLREELYDSLGNYVSNKSVDLPISFVSYGDDTGVAIACRVDGVEYFCNMTTLNLGFPQYVIFTKSGETDYGLADSDQRKMFCEKLKLADKTMFNSEYGELLNNLEDASSKATDAFINCDENEFFEVMDLENRKLDMAINCSSDDDNKNDVISSDKKESNK